MTVAVMLAHKGRDIVTARSQDRMIDVCRLLEVHGIGAIVITDESGRLAGIVSERDLVRALARHGREVLDQPVSEFMTSEVMTCTPEDSLAAVMERMTEGKFRHLPVLEGGRLAGIVSIGDAVKQRIAEAEAETRAMREYITTG
jgi:CBS domain-containing protein